jgi:hypothetical protein
MAGDVGDAIFEIIVVSGIENHRYPNASVAMF